jgi:hypothetical protein
MGANDDLYGEQVDELAGSEEQQLGKEQGGKGNGDYDDTLRAANLPDEPKDSARADDGKEGVHAQSLKGRHATPNQNLVPQEEDSNPWEEGPQE